MRLSLMIGLLLMSVGAASTPLQGAPKGSTAGGACNDDLLHFAEKSRKAVPKKLGELPPGNLVLTVVRQEDGCQIPVIVRYGIGAGGTPAPAPRPIPRRPKLIR